MRNLPDAIIRVLREFEMLFSERVWEWAKILLVGAILAPGKRTVTAVLRVMGLSNERQFQNYHRVLNRANWSPRAASRLLLRLLINAFVPPDAPVVLGLDDHLERRNGTSIRAKGMYRDAVRSSRKTTVTASGLRWLCLMLLAPIPWVERVWALPFLSVLAPSERVSLALGQRPKRLPIWARQAICQVRRWLPKRRLVVVGDSAYAVIELLAACQRLSNPVTFVTRLRLDAALYDPPGARKPGQRGRTRLKGERQPTLAERLVDPTTSWQEASVDWYGGRKHTVELASGTALWYHGGLPPVALRWVLIRDPQAGFEPQALLSTDQEVSAVQIVNWFVMRWQVEVTFEEAREHLGVETQRQWSDRAIARTTPSLLGLYSLVTLFAHTLLQGQELPVRQAAWYVKQLPTFSDTLAFVRQHLWPVTISWISPDDTDMVKIPKALLERLTDALVYAA